MKVAEDIVIHMNAHKDNSKIMSALEVWQNENNTKRLWASDATLWTNSDESQWTGWLNVAIENKEIPRINSLANELKANGITDIVVLGMGGSSLCPAMMATTFGKMDHFPRLHILDSTDPEQIRHLEKQINLPKTFFIVSSKSGSTLEPNIFKDYFYARMQTVLNTVEVGQHFAAITDPGSKLEAIAKKENFKAIFHGVPAIGGRYSALSNFGMVPSGLMGVDIQTFLQHAHTMHQACSASVPANQNPGVVLGIILGVSATQGKNKVTLITSPGIEALGAWLEQLLAESTGKDGKGLIPVDQEPIGDPAVYSNDRIFVYIRLDAAPDTKQDQAMRALEQAGFTVVWLNVPDIMHLGAELFRWEIATAVAGSVLGINPFNQPDVEDSKILTSQLTEQYEKTGQATQETAFLTENGISLFTDTNNLTELKQHLNGSADLAGYLRAHLSRVQQNDYVNLSAFIEMSDEHTALLQESRVLIRDHKKIATCLGFGPRFLHSTGQAYKGGPNTGVFLQITAKHSDDIEVPTHRYTFGFVIDAQAQGDFSVLTKRSRRILRVHLEKDVQTGLSQLRDLIKQALRTNS